MNPSPPVSNLLPEIDLDFFKRVYRTSLIVLLLAALLAWGRFGGPAALGWLLGGILSLTVLWSVEWSVRRYIRPQSQSVGGLLGLSLLKFVVVIVVLGLAYAGAKRGWISLVWVLGGFTLPYAVVVLKLVGQKLVATTREKT